ncbi:thioredoxin domain-containing protein 5 homolog [Homarus americanus]|uniref:Thioredoxin domain-containing protein 5-like n=1 Tax=Homarus americanus TaxID=6706 RepID=A0A8J5N3V9_HOMAM|nr:thioredoxin domain-containing protein 5 homolog [Homarus americanus]KAG7172585.1 Thioredoxin domain-containing protein 5-like [Homarus americanus]
MNYLFLAITTSLTAVGAASDEHGANTVTLTAETFEDSVQGKPNFVMFFAPWCGHCKRLSPTWDDLGKKYNTEKAEVVVGKVDCTQHTALCSSQDVTGYPTLKLFGKGVQSGVKYKGPRDLASLERFIAEQLGTEVQDVEQASVPEALTGLVEYTDVTFKALVPNGRHFIKFYAPWCGHCQRLAPTWESLAKTFEHDKSVTIGKLDCTQFRDICTEYEVKGYPTLLWIEDGKKIEKYAGDRSHEDLKKFTVRSLGDDADNQKEDADEPRPPIAILTSENFENAIERGYTLVKFFAPWCGHCKRMAPTYDELGRKFVGHDQVKIAKVDCTQEVNRALCSEQNVNGFPTLYLYKNANHIGEYNGDRSLNDMVSFITRHLEHDEL